MVGTIPRQAIRELTPTRGHHLLAYFNRGAERCGRHCSTLADSGCPVHVYGTNRRGWQGPLNFLPHSNLPFLEDLAGCRAVVSTAGNQLMGEAIYLGKPVLVLPEALCRATAQCRRSGAAGHRRTNHGQAVHRQANPGFSRSVADLCGKHETARARWAQETLAALDRFLHELAPTAAPTNRPETVTSSLPPS